jgi:hypothetical protein
MEAKGAGNVLHEAGDAEAGIGRIAVIGQQHGAGAEHRPHEDKQRDHCLGLIFSISRSPRPVFFS